MERWFSLINVAILSRVEGSLDIILDPPRGIGRVEIDMQFEQARAELRNIQGYLPPAPQDRQPPGFANYASGMSIVVAPDSRNRVRSIEIYRPEDGVRITYLGIDIFGLPAADVIGLLRTLTGVESEDGGYHFVAPDLLLALGRETLPEGEWDEEGKYFTSVLLAKPGYYDSYSGFTEFAETDNSSDEPGDDAGRLW